MRRAQHHRGACAARCRAVASPSPLLAPVMTTTLPAIPSTLALLVLTAVPPLL